MLKMKRNHDLVQEIERQVRRGGIGRSRCSVRRAVQQALCAPAPQAYLSEEYVIDRLQRRRAGKGWTPKTRLTAQLWSELDLALEQRRHSKPWEPEADRVRAVLMTFRPSGYFITEATALRLYYQRLQNKTPN